MMKTILVLDEMPKRCFDCKFIKSLYNGIESTCIPTGKLISELWEYTDQKEGRPDWCPLKELPARKETKEYEWTYALNAIYADGANQGWNDCLDMIEGKGD